MKATWHSFISSIIFPFIRQAISYAIIGMFSAGIDTFIFIGLFKYFLWNQYCANAISVSFGIICSFFLNRRFTFKATDYTLKRFFLFYGTGLFGLSISQLILWLGNILSLNTLLVKIFSVFFVAAIQFFINRGIAFRKKV